MKKAVIVYYSYSGNTEKLAKYLADSISVDWNTKMVRLKAVDESKNFLIQCARAFKKKVAKIDNDAELDISDYDTVWLGTPVWAFGMAPAMRAFLERCKGLDQKKVVIFTTYGSGAGKDKCVQEMVQIIREKGADEIRSFSVQQNDLNKKVLLDSLVKNVL